MAALRSVTATALAAAPSAAATAVWAPSSTDSASANGPMTPLKRPLVASRSADASAPRRNASCRASTRARSAARCRVAWPSAARSSATRPEAAASAAVASSCAAASSARPSSCPRHELLDLAVLLLGPFGAGAGLGGGGGEPLDLLRGRALTAADRTDLGPQPGEPVGPGRWRRGRPRRSGAPPRRAAPRRRSARRPPR